MAKKKNYSEKELLMNINFDDIFNDNNDATMTTSFALQIKKGTKKVLSKNQQLFNRLIKKIETLEAEIEQTKKLGLELTIAYSKLITPTEKILGKTLFDFALMLDRYAEKLKLTAKQRANFESHIIDLCETALTCIEPEEKYEALYDKYSDTSYKEGLENEKEEMFEDLRAYMEDEMGVDIGDMVFDMNNDEEARQFAEKIKEQLAQKTTEEEEKEKNKKKTKKQIEAELKFKAEEDTMKKSIRSVYISLAKLLHPDTETDEALKLEKTELMKKVTVAYDEKDLATLLKLEMEWVHRTSENIQQLTDEKLKLYNNVLSEQVEELHQEIYHIKMNPAYADVFQLLSYSDKYAHSCLKQQKASLVDKIDDIKHNFRFFENHPIMKSTLIKYLKEVEEFGDDEYGNDDDLFGEFLNNAFLK
ncbi:MAG TPA: hypothetical protein VIK29_02470 [Paludibacter sp.]